MSQIPNKQTAKVLFSEMESFCSPTNQELFRFPQSYVQLLTTVLVMEIAQMRFE